MSEKFLEPITMFLSFETTLLILAVKATAVLIVGFLMARLASRRNPVIEDAVWTTTLLALLLLPLFETQLPKVGPPVLTLVAIDQPEASFESELIGSSRGDVLLNREGQRLAALQQANATTEKAASPHELESKGSIVHRASRWLRSVPLWRTVTVLYFVGLSVATLRLVFSACDLRRLDARSANTSDLDLNKRFSRLVSQLEIRSRVRLKVPPVTQVPMTYGTWQPVVLLPSRALAEMSAQAIDAAMLHELVHIARRDYFLNWLAKLVQTLYWFHPLVHVAVRRKRAVRESVCDSFCVAQLGDRTMYTDVLLSFARRSACKRYDSVGLAMVDSTRLERRLRKMEPSYRYGVSSSGQLVSLAIGLLLTCLVSLTAMAQPPDENTAFDIQSLTMAEIIEGVQSREKRIDSLTATVHFRMTANYADLDASPFAALMPGTSETIREGVARWQMLRDGKLRWEADAQSVRVNYDGSRKANRFKAVATFNGMMSLVSSTPISDTEAKEEGEEKEEGEAKKDLRPIFLESLDTPFALINQQHHWFGMDKVGHVGDDLRLGRIVKRTTWQDAPVVVVEVVRERARSQSARRTVYWVDPQHGFSVVRLRSFHKPAATYPWSLALQVDQAGLEEIAPGIWLPSRVERKTCLPQQSGSRCIEKVRFRITDWQVNRKIDPSQFEFAATEE